MKLIIAGSRGFTNYNLLVNSLSLYTPTEIVTGMARGADSLGAKYAIEHNIPLVKFYAQWGKFGKSAGYIRNAEMANYATHLIVFWDQKSKGSKHMLDLAIKKQLKVEIITY